MTSGAGGIPPSYGSIMEKPVNVLYYEGTFTDITQSELTGDGNYLLNVPNGGNFVETPFFSAPTISGFNIPATQLHNH